MVAVFVHLVPSSTPSSPYTCQATTTEDESAALECSTPSCGMYMYTHKHTHIHVLKLIRNYNNK